MGMTKSSLALKALPPELLRELEALGANLKLARRRRRESQREWASRLGVSVPTLKRLELGDPAVGIGLYATALWLMGGLKGLSALADPARDQGALEVDIRAALQPQRPRRHSLSAEPR